MAMVRRLVALFLVVLLSVPAGIGLAQGVATPDVSASESAFATGIGVPVTAFDERGNPISTVAVTEVELDWVAEEEGFPPTTGKMYVLITLEYSNLSNRPVQVEPWSFMVVDNYGLLADFGYSYGSEVVTDEAISVEGGGTGTLALLFEMWSDTTPMMVMYQPGFSSYVFIHLGD